MTGIPEQPDRRSAEQLPSDEQLMQEIAAVRMWEAGATEAGMERARADRYESEVKAAIFVLAVLRRQAPAAYRWAVAMAETEPTVTVPAWMKGIER